jgi:hypothetical protein
MYNSNNGNQQHNTRDPGLRHEECRRLLLRFQASRYLQPYIPLVRR